MPAASRCGRGAVRNAAASAMTIRPNISESVFACEFSCTEASVKDANGSWEPRT